MAVALMAVGWASAELIMYNAQDFVAEVMQNDLLWAPYLNVNVNLDLNAVSYTGQRIIHDLSVVEQPAAATAAGQHVTRVHALTVVARVVTSHFHESDALELALVVIASAVKCNTLQYLAMQVREVRGTEEEPAPTDVERLLIVWDTMVQYLDKLARLKEPLTDEAPMYREWEAVVRSSGTGTSKYAELAPFAEIVGKKLESTCADPVKVEFFETLKHDSEIENEGSSDSAQTVFARSQNELKKMFEVLPVSTMDGSLWDVYLKNIFAE